MVVSLSLFIFCSDWEMPSFVSCSCSWSSWMRRSKPEKNVKRQLLCYYCWPCIDNMLCIFLLVCLDSRVLQCSPPPQTTGNKYIYIPTLLVLMFIGLEGFSFVVVGTLLKLLKQTGKQNKNKTHSVSWIRRIRTSSFPFGGCKRVREKSTRESPSHDTIEASSMNCLHYSLE